MPDASDKVFGTHRIAQTWNQNLYNWVVLIRLVVGNNILCWDVVSVLNCPSRVTEEPEIVNRHRHKYHPISPKIPSALP